MLNAQVDMLRVLRAIRLPCEIFTPFNLSVSFV